MTPESDERLRRGAKPGSSETDCICRCGHESGAHGIGISAACGDCTCDGFDCTSSPCKVVAFLRRDEVAQMAPEVARPRRWLRCAIEGCGKIASGFCLCALRCCDTHRAECQVSGGRGA